MSKTFRIISKPVYYAGLAVKNPPKKPPKKNLKKTPKNPHQRGFV
jgi:hypothetical protein